MRLNATEKNAYLSVQYLLSAAGVNVTSIGLKEELCLHPDFPSLVSVSDALSTWQIHNLAARLTVSQLREIPVPALAFLTTGGGMFAPIKNVSNDYVEWLDTKKGWQRDSLEIFEGKWNGTVLLLESNTLSGEMDYSSKSRKDFINRSRIPFLIGGFLLCLTLIFTSQWQQLLAAGIHFQILLGTKLIGTLLGGILLWQSLDGGNTFLQNICQLGGENSCNSILQSKAAKVTPWLSWAEIGFIYFSGGFMTLMFALLKFDFSVMSWLLALCVFVLPYTVYSVWYQSNVARQWCLLCLAVQFLFLLEAGIAFSYYPVHTFEMKIPGFSLLGAAFVIPALIWVLIKRPYEDAFQLFDIQRELQKIKFNEDYIAAIFKSQRSMPPIFNEMDVVELGNPAAKHILTVVTNPLCRPCSVRHRQISRLLDSQSAIKCQFIFLGAPRALEIASVFLNTNRLKQKEVLDSWYENILQNSNKWIEKHQLKKEKSATIFQLHRRWCDVADITATPTVFINGVKLPIVYQIKDIDVLIKHFRAENDVAPFTF